jgi:seryl-tRNA synthetase
MSEIDLNAPEVQDAIKTAVEDATKGLVKKRDELLAEVKKARKNSEIDPDEFNRIREENDSLSEKINELTKSAKQYNAELEKFKKAAADESAYSSKLLVETNLNDAINSIGIKPEFNRAVKALFSNQAQVIAGQDGRSVKIGDKSVSDFLKEWADSDEGKSFRAAPLNQGGGSTGGTGGTGGKKTITKSDFRSLDPQQKVDFAKSGGEIID